MYLYVYMYVYMYMYVYIYICICLCIPPMGGNPPYHIGWGGGEHETRDHAIAET